MEECARGKPGPIDMVLYNIMYNSNLDKPGEGSIGACFCWPAIGQQAAHISMATPVPGDPTRDVGWSHPWVSQGAGPVPNKGRWLVAFEAQSSPTRWLKEVHYHHDLRWKTRRPPSRPNDGDDWWYKMLEERGWVDQHGRWWGPWQGKTTSKGGGKGRKGPPSHSPAARIPLSREHMMLRDEPDGYNQAGNLGLSPISRLAEELVVDHRGWVWEGEHTERETRARRFNLQMYKRRCFTDDPYEAGCTLKQ